MNAVKKSFKNDILFFRCRGFSYFVPILCQMIIQQIDILVFRIGPLCFLQNIKRYFKCVKRSSVFDQEVEIIDNI